jgi:anti-anti-sigma regulatory factor
VFFSGDLDATLPSPELLLRQLEGAKVLVLDLSKVSSADSRALEWLEQLTAAAEARRMRLRLVAKDGSKLRKLLEMLGFSRFVLLAGNLREAVAWGR